MCNRCVFWNTFITHWVKVLIILVFSKCSRFVLQQSLLYHVEYKASTDDFLESNLFKIRPHEVKEINLKFFLYGLNK